MTECNVVGSLIDRPASWPLFHRLQVFGGGWDDAVGDIPSPL